MVCRRLKHHAAGRAAAWAMALAMVGWMPGTGVAVAATPAAGVAAALTVGSSPLGAAVYVDGKSVGQTPVTVASLAAGDHRVKVVKDGYLENSRVVSVVSGTPGRVDVNLTPHAANMQVGPATGSRSESSGSSKKWLLIGVGAVAVGGVAALVLTGKNDPPRLGGVTSSPPGTVGIPTLTEFQFRAQASDPNGDTLSYAWDFGDGASGTGEVATHVYQTAGDFTVTVTVSDGKDSVSGTGSARVRAFTGSWRGNAGATTVTFNLQQNGANVTGTWTVPAASFSERLSGFATQPRNLSLHGADTGWSFQAAADADANTLRGTFTGAGLDQPVTFVVRRQ